MKIPYHLTQLQLELQCVYKHTASPRVFSFFNVCCSKTVRLESLEILLDILLVCFPMLLFDL